jgi:fructan beta-fructosidase
MRLAHGAFLALTIAPLVAQEGSGTAPREEILIADFEGESYGEWTIEGEAFGPGPARGTLPGQMEVTGYLGARLVNSYHGGDDSTGLLTSPPFEIERTTLNFLLGGGRHPGEACVELVVGGAVVRTATGPNDRPGGSERLEWYSWEVSELQGRSAILRIVDRRTGGWGHINIDQIVQSDERRQAGPASLEFVVEKRYLHLPVRTGAPKRNVRLLDGAETLREFEIELADGAADFFVFCDLAAFQGKDLRLAVDRLSPGSNALESIVQEDSVPGAEELYREEYRPQFHFSSRRGWNNDPNGLVFHEGEYHLFYQHNPYGWNWGNMHWGHAVSPDLVHWEELPIALYPHEFGDWCFSGSAVVDGENVAGFKSGEDDVIVAFYTSTGRGESVAYSEDRGRTFVEYKSNPVVRHRGRDPKVIWYEPGGHWVMAVYDEEEGGRGIAFYTSSDLLNWTRRSRIDGYYECPELFELPVDGEAGRGKWVVYGADGAYSIGEFDGETFTPEAGKHRFQYGNCFYASQTFNGIPKGDGRRIQIAWGRVGHASMPFNQMMLFPVELTLRSTSDGVRLHAEPVREIASLYRKTHRLENLELSNAEIEGDLLHLEARLDVGEATEFTLRVLGIPIVYSVERAELSCAGCTGPLASSDGVIELEILVDRTSIEIFGGRGRLYLPIRVTEFDSSSLIDLVSKGGPVRIESFAVHELRSAWAEGE